jgi:hypothetical protein
MFFCLLVNISRIGRRLVRCEARNKVVQGSKDSGNRGSSAIVDVSLVVVV